MKIKYILDTVSENGGRDRFEVEFDKNEIILGRGSGSDILFKSRLISFKHARIVIEGEKLFIEDLDQKTGVTRINGELVQKAFLKSEDSLKIGDILLKIQQEGNLWCLLEVREEKEAEDEEQVVQNMLNRMDIGLRMPSYGVLSLVVILPLLLFTLAVPLMGVNEGIWESGPLTDSHKFLEKDCKACHEKTFEKIKDTSCNKCHQVGDHVSFLSKNPHMNEKCAFCHHEHKSNQNLILTGSDLCLNCHEHIKTLNPKANIPSMNGFNATHPEFALIRQKGVDRAQLKLNHNYHLTSVELDDPVSKTKRLMGCIDCHVPDLAGEYTEPVTFDEFCLPCHKLKLGGAAHMLGAPHVKTSLVRSFLKSPKDFLYEFVHASPESLMEAPKASGGRRRRRGPTPEPVQIFKKAWVEKKFDKIERRGGLLGSENEIYFSGQGGCIECHVMDSQPIGALNPDSTLTALSLWDHSIRIWNNETKKDQALLKGHQDILKSAVFSSDGKWLLTGSKDFTARIWAVPYPLTPFSEKNLKEENKTLKEKEISSSIIFKKHSGTVNDAQFNPRLDKIITGSEDKTAIIWNLDNQKPIHILSGNKDSIEKVGFNSDGTIAFTLTSNYKGKIWDVKSGAELVDLENPHYQVSDLVFHPKQPGQIVAALSNGSIKFISATDGKTLSTLEGGQGPVKKTSGHRLEVIKIVFSPDASKLLSSSRDYSAKLWEIASGKVLTTLVVHDKKKKDEYPKPQLFLSASFNPDGSKIVTGSTDKYTRFWDTDSGKLLKEIKSHESEVSTTVFNQSGSHVLSVANNNTAAFYSWKIEDETDFHHNENHFLHNDLAVQNIENELFPPDTLPTNVPRRFFPMSYFNHKKHQYLQCNSCHAGIKKSVFTSDVLVPSIQSCGTCHEKEGIKLNECSVCHFYHPEEERNYVVGPLVTDNSAELGLSFLNPIASDS